MPTKKIRCVTCGRIFYEGQGVRITAGGKELHFHSKACALKFFKTMILYLDNKDLEKAVSATLQEFENRFKELEEKSKKRIEAL
ncbi:hypothetical protein QPL79_01495 [Ignisphaera sp. 4213-co]|uniref:TRASH domain-containing protein n=1 Tax=Ignisphaera cupida TaxID=3050454 RepID=A0ABD4Z5K9_9CREN|nr:hypothetical protein [Ignisphaera sp. 4213-co]MDK6028039.1 hypothetical protein [Ignisphaera sp. 4213-co]